MDRQESLERKFTIPFWDEDHTFCFHIPTGTFFDLTEMNQVFVEHKDVNASRAWWNSNLEMLNFNPQIIPAFENDTQFIALERYFSRVLQRYEGAEVPVHPMVRHEHGLILLERDTNRKVGIITQREDGVFELFDLINNHVSEVVGLDLQRDPRLRYWNGKHYV